MPRTAERSGTVHIVQRLAPGGIETLALDLIRSGGPDDRIISLEGTADGLVDAWPALQPIRQRIEAFAAGPGLKPGLVWRLASRLRTLAPRAVIAHHVGPLVYGGVAARLAGVPRVIHVEHDVWHYATPRRRLLTACLEHAVRPDHVAVSELASTELRAFLRHARITVIPNGIDLERFRPGDKAAIRKAWNLDPDWKVVGTAGRLVAVKGHEVLLAAIARLPADHHVVIAGNGPLLASLMLRARELGIERRAHFLGHVDSVERVLPAFDVFCLPSHAEGFPRSIIEAQAAGLPVVATDVGAVAEALCPDAGGVVPANDPEALAGALRAALARPATLATRAFVAERFSWERTVASYRKAVELPNAA